MKTYCELYITGNHEALEKFVTEIQSYATGNWSAELKNEMGTSWLAFDYDGTEMDNSSVCIPLHDFETASSLHVSNIISLEKNHIDIDEYNDILRKFYNDVIHPYAMDHDEINISPITSDVFDPLTRISKEALDKLTLFCDAANKSTGASHPCDQERWYDFICQTVDDDRIFDYTTLSKFLQDEDYWGKKEPGFLGVIGHFAWDKANAEELASEYEDACSILQYYKRTRGV